MNSVITICPFKHLTRTQVEILKITITTGIAMLMIVLAVKNVHM